MAMEMGALKCVYIDMQSQSQRLSLRKSCCAPLTHLED